VRKSRLADEYRELLDVLRSLQRTLQAEKLKQFKRRVSLGDLITDRWKNAREYGFGEGSSCYDNVLILGDVKVGRHTWIGPNVILDGSGAVLSIGSYCSISAGVQIYTHQTVRRTVTGGQEPIERDCTSVGDRVYIGPNSVIAMGVAIGESAIIGAMSYVNSDVPPRKMAWGCPARIVGDVTL
jgi:acetyltransferase-like isoleucine patch superfamily enzyme